MKKTLGLLVAFCVLSAFEQPQEEKLPEIIETWRCMNEFVWLALQFNEGGYEDIPEDEVIVTLTRRKSKDDKPGSGEVSVTGITHRARFSVEGLERRWDFGENGEYAFVINPQGGGAYYDFSDSALGEIVQPSQTYGCLSNRARGTKGTRRPVEEAAAAQHQIEETELRRRESEMAEQLRREMAEERRNEAIDSGFLDQYKARIRQRIESNWQRPAGSREDLMWVVLLDVLPGNEVADIEFEQFNGTENDRRSIETAIRRSSPLPEPPIPELFERQMRLRYPAIESDVSRVEGGAVPIVRVDPEWPREALMDGTEGYVRCEVLIGPDGSVLAVKVLEAAPGRLFVRNALRAVRRWKFKPRIVDGVAVERWATTSIVFRLDD